MNACTACREQIDLRMDGMLDASLQSQLADHLSMCAACRRYDAAQGALSGDLSALSRVAEVLAAPRVPARRWAPNWMHTGKVAAALAFAVLCTWTFVRQPSIRHQSAPAPVPITSADNPSDVPPPIRFAVSVDPVDEDKRFTIPIQTDNPRVHIVWLYDSVSPVVDPAPASAPSS